MLLPDGPKSATGSGFPKFPLPLPNKAASPTPKEILQWIRQDSRKPKTWGSNIHGAQATKQWRRKWLGVIFSQHQLNKGTSSFPQLVHGKDLATNCLLHEKHTFDSTLGTQILEIWPGGEWRKESALKREFI